MLERKNFEIPVITGLTAIILLLLFSWGFHQTARSTTVHSDTRALAENDTAPPSDIAPDDVNSSRPLESSMGVQPKIHATTAAGYPSGLANLRQSGNSSLSHPSASSSPSSVPVTPLASNPSAAGTPSDLPKPSADLIARPDSSTDPRETPPRLINVSSGVMAANVLSAPQPSYPKLASLTHMQGEVVMQAIISKRGTIEHVRVIKGHRLLRGAATNAVRSWRYRPYLVDGRPVQVATIVSVDFRLSR
jgi:TonB family protein